MTRPILTVAIATCNQPEELFQTLKSLMPQVSNLNIEVLIRDDSDNLKTKDIVEKFKNSHIKYHHGKKQGLDFADMWLMQSASGEYVWWFGDDIFIDNAIKHILDVLKMQPDFVWINSKSEVQTKKIGSSRWMSGSEVILEIGDLLTFISALLWRKDFFITEIWRSKRTLGNCMSYMYPQIECLSKGGKYYYCDEPLFVSRKRDFSKLWYDPFIVFSKNYFDALDFYSKKNNLKNALMLEKQRRGLQILKGVLYYRLTSKNYGLGITKNLTILFVYWRYPYFWKFVPLFLIPGAIMSLIGKSLKFK